MKPQVGLVLACCALSGFIAIPLQSQSTLRATTAAKSAAATRIQHAAPHTDGVLDDSAWSVATPISDFVQKNPVEGSTPSERTEVRIIHDDEALYIGEDVPGGSG